MKIYNLYPMFLFRRKFFFLYCGNVYWNASQGVNEPQAFDQENFYISDIAFACRDGNTSFVFEIDITSKNNSFTSSVTLNNVWFNNGAIGMNYNSYMDASHSE